MDAFDEAMRRGADSLWRRYAHSWAEITLQCHEREMQKAETTEAFLKLLLRRWQRYGSEMAYRKSMMRRGEGYLESWMFNAAYHTLGYHAQTQLEANAKEVFAAEYYLRSLRFNAWKFWLLRHVMKHRMERKQAELLFEGAEKTARRSKGEALLCWLDYSTNMSFREAAWYRVLDFLSRFSLMCWRSTLRIRAKQQAFVRKSLNYWINYETAKAFLKLRLVTQNSKAYLAGSAREAVLFVRKRHTVNKWIRFLHTRAWQCVSTEKAMLRWLLTQVTTTFTRWREEAKYSKLTTLVERWLNRPFTVWRKNARILREENLRRILLGWKDVHLSTATRWWTSMSAERKAEQAFRACPRLPFHRLLVHPPQPLAPTRTTSEYSLQ